MAVKKATKKTAKKTTKQKKPARYSKKKATLSREIWGIIYITLAVITVFSLLKFEGFLLGFYYNIITMFIGFGIYILPISFLALGILCFTNFKGNVSLRSMCILGSPVLMSCFVHVILFGDRYRLNMDDLSIIISKGLNRETAGLVGGFVSIILESSLSSVGALILLFALNVVNLFICFNLTPSKVYKTLSDYFDSLAYEDDDEEIEYKLQKKEMRKIKREKQKEHKEKLKEAQAQARAEYKEQVEIQTPKKYKKFNIDIPLDDESIADKLSVLDDIDESIRPKVDEWIVEAYEKILERDLIRKKEKEQMFADISKEVALEVQNELLYENIKPVIEEPHIDHIVEDLDEIIINDFSNEKEVILDITSDIDKILNNNFPSPIEEAMEEVAFENTNNYEMEFNEIIPDTLKSTMTYETVSEFNAEKLSYEYKFPPMELLKPKLKGQEIDPKEELFESSKRLLETLESFSIKAEIINIVRGPSVTRFEITISRGVKFSKITALSDDIALSLGAVSVRIAPIPDKVAIGIEVPNKSTEIVLISEVINSNEFKNTTSKLSYALGKDITGRPAIGDIAKMPHMLVAGTTGSGKSVCVNSLLVSLLYKAKPDEVKFIMIDPKMVELSGYNGIPHLLIPVVTDPKKAAGALNWAVSEMMKRYKLFSECNVKDLFSYNKVMEERIDAGEQAEKMPQVVIVIDELADLMMIAAKEVEEAICRIAQMARAAGMHLIIATQRPSSDVITGIMKANIPSRISFAVSSQIESRIILDTTGAEKLIGKGDMLYSPLGAGKPQRLQGCFISSREVEEVVEFVKTIAEPSYNEDVLNHIENHASRDGGSPSSSDDLSDEDSMLEEAIDIIVSTGQASTSFLQRKLKVGYARASRMIDQIEDRGIISGYDGSKARQILITKHQWQEMRIRKLD